MRGLRDSDTVYEMGKGRPEIGKALVGLFRNSAAWTASIAVAPAIANAAQQTHQVLQTQIADIIAKGTLPVVCAAIVGGVIVSCLNIRKLIKDVSRPSE